MSVSVRFPCSCGMDHPVALYQAGEILRCSCGRELELPTMRKLRNYPPFEKDRGRPQPAWSTSRGVIFNLGLMLSLGSIAALIVFGQQRWNLDLAKPELPDSELYDLEVSRWPVSLAWKFWTLAKTTDLSYRLTPRYQQARQWAARLTTYLIAAAVGLAVGGAAMTGALLVRRE